MKLARRDMVRGALALGSAALTGAMAGRVRAQDIIVSAPSAPPAPPSGDALQMARFLRVIPKAEYHVHVEGTLEPALAFKLAQRNAVPLPFADVAALAASRIDLDQPRFLAAYREGVKVLLTEQDFHDLALAYLARAASQNVLHAEMVFEPALHVSRGLAVETALLGISRARGTAARLYGISSGLILGLGRELEPDAAARLLEGALPWREHLVGVGLEGDVRGHAPARFAALVARAREGGLKVAAQCEGAQLRQAVVDLKIDRIDHGGAILAMPDVMALARQRGLALTVCPGFPGEPEGGDAVRQLLDAGLDVTLTSHAPAYGGAYLTDVLARVQNAAGLTQRELLTLARNAIGAAWIADEYKARLLARLDIFARAWG